MAATTTTTTYITTTTSAAAAVMMMMTTTAAAAAKKKKIAVPKTIMIPRVLVASECLGRKWGQSMQTLKPPE